MEEEIVDDPGTPPPVVNPPPPAPALASKKRKAVDKKPEVPEGLVIPYPAKTSYMMFYRREVVAGTENLGKKIRHHNYCSIEVGGAPCGQRISAEGYSSSGMMSHLKSFHAKAAGYLLDLQSFEKSERRVSRKCPIYLSFVFVGILFFLRKSNASRIIFR